MTDSSKKSKRRKRRHRSTARDDDALSFHVLQNDNNSKPIIIEEKKNVLNFEKQSKPDVSKFSFWQAEASFVDILQSDQYVIRDRNLGLTE